MMMCLEIKTPAVVALAHDCCKPALDAVFCLQLSRRMTTSSVHICLLPTVKDCKAAVFFCS